jgi:7,8-dihydroneopterin aldolase/epimerase/oxygenase
VVVNIDLSVKEGSGDDDISHVVSYEIIVKKVEAIIEEGHINLVETLCEKIAASCLKDRRVIAARVRVEKPDIIPNARSVGVEIERGR